MMLVLFGAMADTFIELLLLLLLLMMLYALFVFDDWLLYMPRGY